MKFVHISDMHFDAPFRSISDKAGLGEKRRLEQRQVFKKVIDYIKENNIPYLFISGDLYEDEYVRKSTIEYINEQFRKIPDTKIYIAPGNHDPYTKNSYYSRFNFSDNVKIFDAHIEKIQTEDFDLYGYGFDNFYCENSDIEQIQIENKDKINILITHASLDSGSEEERKYNPISSSRLKSLGFDYIALGHIHKRMIDGSIVYPGSTISLGFDEIGEHGMIVGDITKQGLNLEFISLDLRQFREIEYDISDIFSIEELIEKINEIKIYENYLYKIILKGNRNFEINIFEILKLIDKNNIIKIKDETKIAEDFEKAANDTTLRGLFIKNMLEDKKEGKIPPEILEKALEIGINIFD